MDPRVRTWGQGQQTAKQSREGQWKAGNHNRGKCHWMYQPFLLLAGWGRSLYSS